MKRPTGWLVVPLLWLATILRFTRLDAQSFWNDEGNSARLAERSVVLIVEGAAGDVHPPLYYLLLAGWRQLLGQSEFALRALSAFAGLLLVAGVFALGSMIYVKGRAERRGKTGRGPAHDPGAFSADGRGPALLATLLAAVHPALIYYSQEARMYALLGLWAVLAALLFIRLLPLLAQPAGRPLYAVAAGYLLVAIAGLYTHYFFPVVLLIHNLLIAAVLLRMLRQKTAGEGPQTTPHTAPPHSTHHTQHATSPHPFTPSPLHLLILRWPTLMLAAFLAYLPWLPIFLRQTGGRAADPISAASFLTGAARWLALGETASGEGLWLPIAALFALAVIGIFTTARTKNAEKVHRQTPIASRQSPIAISQPPASSLQSPISTLHTPHATLYILLPPLLILLLGATRPAYYKFLIVAPPFLALLVAQGALRLWRGLRRVSTLPRLALGGALFLLLGLALWGSALSLRNLYFNPAFARADYRGIASRISAERHANAGIILNAANQWEVFTYYHRDGAPVYPLPRGQPDPQGIAADLEDLTARHDRLYALFWGEAERDPQRLVERWLDANTFKAREEWVGDVRFVTYAVPPEPVTTMETPAGVQFGQQITLNGYTLRGSGAAGTSSGGAVQTSPGDILQVALFWQTAQPLDTRYKVFLHLTGGAGPPLAQRDAEPVGNLAPTTTWQPGQTIVDNQGLFIPGDLPAGRYDLVLGLYPLDNPAERLNARWTESGETRTADSFVLGIVTVR